MSCLSPVVVKFPPDKSGHYSTVLDPYTGEKIYGGVFPCGRCIPCKIQKSREWALRCCLELPYWHDSSFITLTYDDEHLPERGSLRKDDLQKFFKRLRRDLEPLKIKYFASGEYGSHTERPHYHAIVFGLGADSLHRSQGLYVEQNWPFGKVFCGSCTYNSARYCAEYVFKKYNGKLKQERYVDAGLEVPFQLQSLGIGKQYLLDNLNDLYNRGYILYRGGKFSLPRYFVNFMQDYDESRYFAMRNRLITERVDDFGGDYSDFIIFQGVKDYDKALHQKYKSIFYSKR